tara:strand:- start:843 stop:1673 length:831 start_codon:yes stop_codon:yes gene_type:complete
MAELWNVFTSLELFLLMAFPSNKDSRDKFMANKVARMKEEWPELSEEQITQGKRPDDWSIERWGNFVKDYVSQLGNELDGAFSESGGIVALLNSGGYDAVMSDYHENCYRGALAGHILTYIRRMTDSGLASEASTNKAIFLIEEIIGRKMRRELEKECKSIGNRFIRAAWSDFKLVSPLWAAYGNWVGWKKPSKCSPFLPEGFLGFISLANNFREFGIAHLPRAQKVPTLPPDETWPRTEGLPLMNLTVNPHPLSEDELKILDDYQAPGSYLSSRP